MINELDNYDWQEAFDVAQRSGVQAVIGSNASTGRFSRDDVGEIIAKVEGENDGESWVGVFRLLDGRFAYITDWCDYTGWG